MNNQTGRRQSGDAQGADDVDGPLGEGVETADRRPSTCSRLIPAAGRSVSRGAATSLMPGCTNRSTPISDNAQPNRRKALPEKRGVGGDDHGFGTRVAHGEQSGFGPP